MMNETAAPFTDADSAHVYRDGQLSIGLMLPLRETDGSMIDFGAQVDLARHADELGFAAVWVRDVPLNGPWYPESFGHPDPFVMLGAIAASTSRIALGTGATVLTLRHPLHVAKAAISLDLLSQQRLILGLGAGDRREEFAAFGAVDEDRRGLFQRHWDELAGALQRPSQIKTTEPNVWLEMRPQATRDIPLLAIGSAGQSLEWIVRHARGWTTYHRPPPVQQGRYALWRRAVDHQAPGQFRSFSVAMQLDLVDDIDAPAEPINLGYRAGTRALLDVLRALREAGVHHVILGLAPTGVAAAHKLDWLARDVLPALHERD